MEPISHPPIKSRRLPVAPVIHAGRIDLFPAELMASLEEYTPADAPKEWVQVSRFVRDAVVAALPTASLTPKKLIGIVARFVLWAVVEQGLPQETSELFTPRVIDAYCAQLTTKGSTSSTYRSALMNASRMLNPDVHANDMRPIQRREITAPYTAAEMSQFRRWAKGQTTATLRVRGMAMLALTAGAGLSPADIGLVEYDDVEISDAGVALRIRGKAPRLVPVLRDWEKWVLKVRAAREPGDLLWGTPKRATPNKNLIPNFTQVASGNSPHSARLRATWITAHLALGTPMKALFRAGGFAQLANLDQYLEYVEAPSDDDFRRLLRGSRR